MARKSDGTTLTQLQLNANHEKRLAILEAKTRDLEIPAPPPLPKTDAERIAELEATIAVLNAAKKPAAAKKASTIKAVQS